jgi:hypothetical protein
MWYVPMAEQCDKGASDSNCHRQYEVPQVKQSAARFNIGIERTHSARADEIPHTLWKQITVFPAHD